MKNDNLTWLGAELGFRILDESIAEGSDVPFSDAACDGESGGPEGFVDAVWAALDRGIARDQLALLIDGARAGSRTAVHYRAADGHAARAWLMPITPGFAQIVIGAVDRDALAELSRRAQVADAAAAVAHEVANATSAIAGWSKLAEAGRIDGVAPEEALRLVGRAAETADQAARRLLRIARGHADAPLDHLDLSQSVADLVALLAVVARESNVRLTRSIAPEIAIRGASAQVFTIVWNLTKNAIEAAGNGGSVHVALLADQGTGARIDVTDSGPGLSAEAIARIFDPYYSTKTHGTGLGLPLVRAAIDELLGTLEITPGSESGTTFRVLLPRLCEGSFVGTVRESDGYGPTADNTTSASHTAGQRADALDIRVLIVEDDLPLREMMATALTLRGARVTTARSALEARALQGNFDIALIDMALDECRGDELLVSLRRRGVVSAAMLVTGSVQKPRLTAGGEPDDWVRKPFEITELVERIRRTLARHAMLASALSRTAGE